MRLFSRLVILELSLATILFGSAGRLDLPWFWALIGFNVVLISAAARAIEPDLMRERLRPAPGGVDRSLRWLMLPFLLAQLIVAGLDVGRFGWSGPVPLVVHGTGLLPFVSGIALAMRAMVVNRFLSPVVRIQVERGHRLITEGPYRFVRHPGYAGMLLSFLGGMPKSVHAALRLDCFLVDVCVTSSSCSSSTFNSARHSSGVQRQPVRRSLAIASRVCSTISSHRPDTTAARN